MANFQRRDFAAMDSALMALSAGTKPEPSRFWWERTKGASKDTDAAVQILWLLTFSNRPLAIQVGAADQDQADEVRKVCKGILRLNSWLSNAIDIQGTSIINHSTDSTCDILSADVAGSHGARPDVLVINELSHISKREFAENLADNASKVPHGIVLVCTNAGFIGSWQEQWRKTAMNSPRWHFSAFQDTAPWLDAAEIAEARRRNSLNRFLRLFKGQWVPDVGDALNPDDVDAAVKLKGPLDCAEPGWAYALGLDIGIAKHATGLVLVGKRESRYRLAYTKRWLPIPGQRVNLADVESEILSIHARFRLRVGGFDPWQSEYLSSRLAARMVPMKPVSFSGSNLAMMATCLLDAFTSGSMAIYDEPGLKEDLRKLRIVEKSYGQRLDSPVGPTGHGDLATALAIALLVAKPLYAGSGSGEMPICFGRYHGQADLERVYPIFGVAATYTDDDGDVCRMATREADADRNMGFGYRPWGGR
jgi:hypothetical protein